MVHWAAYITHSTCNTFVCTKHTHTCSFMRTIHTAFLLTRAHILWYIYADVVLTFLSLHLYLFLSCCSLTPSCYHWPYIHSQRHRPFAKTPPTPPHRTVTPSLKSHSQPTPTETTALPQRPSQTNRPLRSNPSQSHSASVRIRFHQS